MKTLCHCCPLNGCLWGKQVPFSSGRHTDTKGTHFLWLWPFAYTLPLSSCLLAPTSCQADRGFMPTQWQVSDGKALCLKKTLRPLSPSVWPPPPCHPPLCSLILPVPPHLVALKHLKSFLTTQQCTGTFTCFWLNCLHWNTFVSEHWWALFRTHFVDPTGALRPAHFSSSFLCVHR